MLARQVAGQRQPHRPTSRSRAGLGRRSTLPRRPATSSPRRPSPPLARGRGDRRPDARPGPAAPRRLPTLPDWLMYAGVVVFGLGLARRAGDAGARRSPPAHVDAEERVPSYTAGSPAAGGRGPAAPRPSQALTQAKRRRGRLLAPQPGLEAAHRQRLEAAGSELKLGGVAARARRDLRRGRPRRAAAGPRQHRRRAALHGARRRRALALPRASAQRAGARPSTPLLPDTLQLMSGSLSAGLSLTQSVDTIVREGAEPIAVGVQAGAGRDPARRARSRTPSTASPSASTARTSRGW